MYLLVCIQPDITLVTPHVGVLLKPYDEFISVFFLNLFLLANLFAKCKEF